MRILETMALTMPLFFASGAIYPVAIVPEWLQALSRLNPLTYAVDALQSSMLAQATSVYGIGFDLGIMDGATAPGRGRLTALPAGRALSPTRSTLTRGLDRSR